MLRHRLPLFLLSLSLASPAAGQTLQDPALSVETVVSGLAQITSLAFLAPDDFLVVQKYTGKVFRVRNGALVASPVLDVAVNAVSERGLLGIAVDSASPPHVFLYYTEAAVDDDPPIANRVYRYTWNPTLGALESPVLVLDLPVLPGPNHDGGVLVLGPPGEAPGVGDGSLLYAVIGELNRNGQLANFPAGDPPDDAGVILRVRQDGTPAPGNPFTPYCSTTTTTTCGDDLDCPGGETCTTEVARYFAYGVRNSYGLALDPVTGDLWDTENGPNVYDEINRVAPGTNSGWEQIMGPDARDAQGVGDLFDMPGAGSTYRDPEFSWLATIAPTGIVFPAGSNLGPDYDGVVLVADHKDDALYAFPLAPDRESLDLTGYTGVADRVADSAAERDQFLFGSGFDGPTDLTIGPDGQLYVVALVAGTVYRVVGPGRAAPVPALPLASRVALAVGLLMAAVLGLRAQRTHWA